MTQGSEQTLTRSFAIPESVDLISILGPADNIVRVLEKGFPGVSILINGRTLSIAGTSAQVTTVKSILRELVRLAKSGSPWMRTASNMRSTC